jgi:hypothetical protein
MISLIILDTSLTFSTVELSINGQCLLIRDEKIFIKKFLRLGLDFTVFENSETFAKLGFKESI